MKIVHISISGAYTDNLSYQENYLTKYHVILGHDVYLITSEWMYDDRGNYVKAANNDYIDCNGVHIFRLKMCGKDNISKRIRRYFGLKEKLEEISPDIIFHHGCQSPEEATVAAYCRKHKKVRLFVDNHSDFSNSASNWLSKNIQHKILWKHYARIINPYVEKFYGVLPARVDFLIDMYGLPKEKVELLVMGADDELACAADNKNVKKKVRDKHNIKEEDFLIMTGGKIDLFKQQTLLLMDAVNAIDSPNVKLIVFGSVIEDLKDEVRRRCSEKVQYIGWIQSDTSYQYFAASDLVVFPGRHSVFWEQVVGQGIPMIVKYWAGTTHVNCGGNVRFLHEDSIFEIQKCIEEVIDSDTYDFMKCVAINVKEKFLYSQIAKKSIGIV